MNEEEYNELIRELGGIELYIESLQERRAEIIAQLRDEGMGAVKITPTGAKMKNAMDRQASKHKQTAGQQDI